MPMTASGQFKRIVSPTITIAEIAATASADQTFTIGEGVTAENFVIVNIPSLTASVTYCNAHISANGVLKIRFSNATGAPITPGALLCNILVH